MSLPVVPTPKALDSAAPARPAGPVRPVLSEGAVRCAVRRVTKSFGAQPILREVDLDVPTGSFAVLVGPSGCGKSTLLRCIAGLETVDAGTITLGERDVTHLEPRDRDVAMVFQSYALYPHLTVRENLAFGLKLRGASRAEIDERVIFAAHMLGLDQLFARYPKQLSGGQRQRVAMGRAIVRRPTIFLFDEPLSNLDAALRGEVRIEIRRMHDRLGATTLYVTHDQVEAMTLADTLWVMNGGRVEQSGTPLDVYEHPRTRFVATFLGSPAMNLVDAKLVEHGEHGGAFMAEGHGVSVLVEKERFGAALQAGRAVHVGVRPHDLVPCEPSQGALTLHVEFVEALGFEALVHGTAGPQGARITVRLEAGEARTVHAGAALSLAARPGKAHLFDAATGASLEI